MTRWPLLLAALACLATAVGLDVTTTTATLLVEVLLVLSAVLLGAFVYAEGVRWRERRETEKEWE